MRHLTQRLRRWNSHLTYTPQSRMTPPSRLYQPSSFDQVENIERYRPGGFHPIHIDTLLHNKYHILHKLGFGGFSTVWLARNIRENRLVAVKVKEATHSASRTEVEILQYLSNLKSSHAGKSEICYILDSFTVKGPNGHHACLVSELACLSAAGMSDSPGAVMGSRRLRADVARNCAKQIALALDFLHSNEVVHGDVTTNNILLKFHDMENWDDMQIYQNLGLPQTESVLPSSSKSMTTNKSAPQYVVECPNLSNLAALWNQPRAILADFGSSFRISDSTSSQVRTPFEFRAPEHFFGSLPMTKHSDMWAFGCVIFALRAGRPLFSSFQGRMDEILLSIVATLGKPPESIRIQWEDPRHCLLEKATSEYDHLDGSQLDGQTDVGEYSLAERINDIGMEDGEEGEVVRTDLHEARGKRVSIKEASLLEDLLGKMLIYNPVGRLSASQVLDHPWFRLD